MRRFIGYNIIWNSRQSEKPAWQCTDRAISCIWRILCGAQCLTICNQFFFFEMTDMKSKYYKLNASPSVDRINWELNWFVVDHKNIIVNKDEGMALKIPIWCWCWWFNHHGWDFFSCHKVNCIIKPIGYCTHKRIEWFDSSSLVKILNLKWNLNKCSSLCMA